MARSRSRATSAQVAGKTLTLTLAPIRDPPDQVEQSPPGCFELLESSGVQDGVELLAQEIVDPGDVALEHPDQLGAVSGKTAVPPLVDPQCQCGHEVGLVKELPQQGTRNTGTVQLSEQPVDRQEARPRPSPASFRA